MNLQEQIKAYEQTWNFAKLQELYENEMQDENIRRTYINFLHHTGKFEEFLSLANDDLIVKELKSCLHSQDLKVYINDIKDEQKKLNTLAYYLTTKDFDLTFALEQMPTNEVSCKISLAYIIKTIVDNFEHDLKALFNVPKELNLYQSFPAIRLITAIQNNFYPLSYGARIYNEKIYSLTHMAFFENKVIRNKNKIALLIVGALRGDYFSQIKDSINKLALPLNADVFITAWDKLTLWPGICGTPRWNLRLLDENFKICPEEISLNKNFRSYFPKTYSKLDKEYTQNYDFSNLLELQNVKSCNFLNQDEFEKNYTGGRYNFNKLFYTLNEAFKSMKEYESKNNFEYDYIIRIRPDSNVNSIYQKDLINLNDNEIANIRFESGGLNDLAFYGSRSAMKKVLCMFELAPLNKELGIFPFYPEFKEAHSVSTYWHFANKLQCKPHIFAGLMNSIAFRGLCFPNVDKEIEQDIQKLRTQKRLNETKIQAIQAFFLRVKNSYTYKHSALAIVKNHLSYKFGIEIEKSKFKSPKDLLELIKNLVQIYKQHNINKVHFAKIDLSLCPDHKEALEVQNGKAYLLGKALIKAMKNKAKFPFNFMVMGGGL